MSTDPRNRRSRTSVLVSVHDVHLLIDASIDLRQQCLRYGVGRVDAILFTHHHADHIFGLDDTRPFSFRNKSKLPCFADARTCGQLRHVFSYIFDYPDIPGGIPMLDIREVTGSFEFMNIPIEPIEIFHGTIPILAYRIGDFVYATDCSRIPEESYDRLKNVETLVLDCLRFKPHPTHFHFDRAIEVAKRINARRTFFTHMSHDLEHDTVSRQLPERMHLAYDGLRLACEGCV